MLKTSIAGFVGVLVGAAVVGVATSGRAGGEHDRVVFRDESFLAHLPSMLARAPRPGQRGPKGPSKDALRD